MEINRIFLLVIIINTILSLETQFIKYEEDKTTAILTINRPKALNALNSQVLDEIDKTLDDIDLNKIKALIITGSGEKSFVAGADIAEMSTLTKKEGEAFGKKGNDIFRKLEEFPIPVIAAINGFALGGGCEIAMSCDIRICSENAIFGQPEVGLGITPGFGGTQRLARIVGPGMAKQMIFTAKSIKAEEALRIGLVNEIYPQNELLANAKKIADNIGKNIVHAVKNSKEAINDGLQVDMDKAIEIEEKLFGDCFETNEQREAMDAFLHKGKSKKQKDNQNIYKLICAAQNYDWGRPANNSLVAEALIKNGQPVDKTKNYAEYWMGTHPNGPSKIIKDGKEVLLSDEINGQLSYLFEILSINKPLSIQLHPDKENAEILHKNFPKNYKDDNHKPELFIALSDFELLFGLVPLDKAVEIMKKYKKMFNLEEGEKLINEPSTENYKYLIEKLIFLEKDEYENIIKLIIEDKSTSEDSLVKKLYDNFGLDSGILISLFMNHFHKQKGESFFIDANIPHAYIYGNCLELMACSDNVIRLGLTPKLVDKENFDKIIKDNLEEMIYDENNKEDEVQFVKIDKENKITTYDVDFIDDFKLQVFDIDKNRNINIEKNSILFCLEGTVKINGVKCEDFNSLFVENEIKEAKIELSDGYSSAKLYKVYRK
jgi:enoyl-CoA hydratase